jgi:uncharacterized protein
MSSYHADSKHPLRRKDKQITGERELLEIIQGQQFMTLAMCKDQEPYLVSLNYGFDPEVKCFYFHCAHEGKKLDYLRANPIVWGQVIQDHGYLDGECSHAFRSVEFRGQVTLLDDLEAKRAAFNLMIEQLESDPEAIKQRSLQTARLKKVVVGKIQVEYLRGKRNDVA